MREARLIRSVVLIASTLFLASCSSESSANTPPKIMGTPSPDVVIGETYLFQPAATDAERARLKFFISGKPAWATFDATSGKLSGAPRAPDAGSYGNIQISVSDGKYTTSLAPFAVKVTLPRKAAYGHYFATRYADTPEDAAMLCGQPGVRGVVWRRTWSEVEPQPGVYDFSSFDQALATLAGSSNPQCQVWLFIEFKSFASSPLKNPCPPYLQAQYSGLNADGNGARTCFMWEPVVVQAYAAMMRAAAARYDANPRVEGFILQESALGFNGTYSQDLASGGTYTAEAWRDALVQLVGQCGASFKRSRCMSFLNFLRGGQRYLYDVAAAIAAIPQNRGCISGPDLLPDETPLYANDASIYEVITRHTGCRSNSAQNDSYAVPGCDLACIFRFGVSGTFGDFPQDAPRTGGLCVNSYLFWNHRVTASATGLDWADALPVIAARPYGRGWLDQCAGGGGVP
jgi:hypothetical protein